MWMQEPRFCCRIFIIICQSVFFALFLRIQCTILFYLSFLQYLPSLPFRAEMVNIEENRGGYLGLFMNDNTNFLGVLDPPSPNWHTLTLFDPPTLVMHLLKFPIYWLHTHFPKPIQTKSTILGLFYFLLQGISVKCILVQSWVLTYEQPHSE